MVMTITFNITITSQMFKHNRHIILYLSVYTYVYFVCLNWLFFIVKHRFYGFSCCWGKGRKRRNLCVRLYLNKSLYQAQKVQDGFWDSYFTIFFLLGLAIHFHTILWKIEPLLQIQLMGKNKSHWKALQYFYLSLYPVWVEVLG